MIMGPGLRKFVLTVHVVVSVGWIGAVMAYTVLDLAVATSQGVDTLRASYVAMELVTMRAIVPLAFASLGTGLVVSLGTKWGLFRHYWVLVSLVLTIIAVIVLVSETRVISNYAAVARDPGGSDDEVRSLGNTLVHSIGGLLVLLVVLVLNMYKPRGLTPYGERKLREDATPSPAARRARR